MTNLKRIGVVFLIVSLLTVGGAGTAAAQDGVFLPQLSSPTADDGEFNVEYAVPANYRAAAQNFTSAAARAAVPPLEWHSEDPLDAIEEPAPTGTPRRIDGGMPNVEADLVAQTQYAEAWAAIDAAQQAEAVAALQASATDFEDPGVNYSGSTHTSMRGNAYGRLWDAYPFRAVGKVYMYENVGTEEEPVLVYAGYCTASVMGQENIIVTAAHCLYDQNDEADPWYDAWEFVPADRDGAAPYGSWWANNAIVRGPWTEGGGRNYDVGLLSLSYKYIDGAWRPVSYYTGWLGRVVNFTYLQHLFAFGYPSNLEGGRFTYICAAESYWGGVTDYISMGCDMTFGSSGGPWIWKFSPYRGWNYNYLMSVVSGGVPGSNVFTGPRFSDDNIGSLCTTWFCGSSTPRP